MRRPVRRTRLFESRFSLNYLILGVGGTGGMLAFTLARAGRPVEIVARGAHLEAIRENGLVRHTMWDDRREFVPLSVYRGGTPDVVFLCVKSYSAASFLPFLREHADAHTVVIPILNGIGNGARLQKQLPGTNVLDGCIYVSANIESPGVILQHAPILRVVFGRRDGAVSPRLEAIAADLRSAGMEAEVSRRILRDTLEKFSYVSAAGTAGLVFGVTAGGIQHPGPPRDYFVQLVRETEALGDAMGCHNEKDLAAKNLQIIQPLPPETTTSMQRDILAGRPSEADGLIREPVRLGKKYGVPTPAYERGEKWLCENTNGK